MPLRPLCRSTIPSSSSSFTVAAAAAAALRTPRRGFLRQALAGAGVTLGSGLALPFRTAFADQHSAAALVPDWDVPGGHFYTQTAPEGAPSDTGYVVSNADEVEFWRRYQALGGPAELGYPVSSRYEAGGTIYQVMQAGVLRWNPTAGGVEVHPAMVALAELEMDGWLEAWGIPRTSPDLLKNPALPAETRLGWLTHPTLEAAYLESDEAAARQRFGLPMGGPARFGPYMAQRFDKAVLQLWLDVVPGQPAPGTVAPALVGNLIKEAGLIPEAALAPQPAPAPRPVVEAPKPARVLIAAPAAPGRGKQIVVSLSRQWWYAYQDGNVVFNGPVTTGQPELRTPRGRFTVLSRQSPFTFVSPWPRGHRFWYAPSPCTYALRITGNGVYLHDAPWRPFYGPGTNVPHYDPDGVWRTGSHGCINLPYGAAAWLWSFAPVGTPVQVV